MHRPTRTRRLPSIRSVVRSRMSRCALVAGVVLAGATPANAGLVTATTHTASNSPNIPCVVMGQSDNNGVFYGACGLTVYRWNRNEVAMASIPLTGLSTAPRDVAPSPDGRFLYVVQASGTPRRFNRRTDGTYGLDATWRLQKFYSWNVRYTPIGSHIATDGRGDIYISNGSLAHEATQRSIVKYTPAGAPITVFGDYGRQPGNWVTNQDIAVSRDGRRVFIGENCGTNCIYGTAGYNASRITRYDYNASGLYRFSRIVSAQGDGKTFPACTAPAAVHSGYSLALDFAENLYVTSTTCGLIQKFDTDADPLKDRYVGPLATWTDQPSRNHYLGVTWRGRIFAYQWKKFFTPKTSTVPALPLPALAPLPRPDVTAPTLTNVALPATTQEQDITVTITASDDRAVTEMRLAREDGTFGPWQPFATPVRYQLSDGYGFKGVYVQVRDMAGNESTTVYRTTGYSADAPPPPTTNDTAAPTLTVINVPAMTATRDITIGVTATDNVAVAQVRLANEDGTFGAWTQFTANVAWTLSANVGAKAVYVQVRDAAGNESVTLMGRTQYTLDAPPPGVGGGGIAPDAVAPVLSALQLPAETTTQTVTATLTATDNVAVSQVRFANEDGQWGPYQAWATTKQWTLSAGYGGKVVYAQVRDAAGNESAVLTSRISFVLTTAGPADTAAPVLSAMTIPATTTTQAITVNLAATDNVAITQIRLANEDGTFGAWKAWAPATAHTLSAGLTYKVVYAQVRDAAGNESNVLNATTRLVAP